MTVNLEKGQKLDLTKGNASLDKVCVALGWDVNKGNGKPFDLDAFIIALDETNKPVAEGVCFYGKKVVLNESISHSGDNLTGAGDGDDETITVTLSKLPTNVNKLIIAANIYEAVQRGQNFGQVRSAFVRVYNAANKEEFLKYDLGEEYSTFQGVVFGELYKHNGEWKFGAISNGFNGTINDCIAMY